MLVLFDIDNTLVDGGEPISQEMIDHLDLLLEKGIDIGIVAGGEYAKISEQMGSCLNKFKYVFTDCGSVLHRAGALVYEKDMMKHSDRVLINMIIRQALIAIVSMPVYYHSGQINIRKGSIYITPSGIHSGSYEKDIFIEMDKKLKLIDDLVARIRGVQGFDEHFEIVYGELGCTLYPKGWSKEQVLNHIKDEGPIYYLADRTYKNGIDHSLYFHSKVIGITVKGTSETMAAINEILSVQV